MQKSQKSNLHFKQPCRAFINLFFSSCLVTPCLISCLAWCRVAKSQSIWSKPNQRCKRDVDAACYDGREICREPQHQLRELRLVMLSKCEKRRNLTTRKHNKQTRGWNQSWINKNSKSKRSFNGFEWKPEPQKTRLFKQKDHSKQWPKSDRKLTELLKKNNDLIKPKGHHQNW